MRSSFGSPLHALGAVCAALALAAACGPKAEPKTPDQLAAEQSASIAAAKPPCVDAPANPAEVIAKEPTVFNACLTAAGKPDPNICGFAKVSVTIGKDGKVSNAQVADSTLPASATDCIKARLAAMQFACPKEGSGTYTIPVGLPVGGTSTGACTGLPTPPGSPPP